MFLKDQVTWNLPTQWGPLSTLYNLDIFTDPVFLILERTLFFFFLFLFLWSVLLKRSKQYKVFGLHPPNHLVSTLVAGERGQEFAFLTIDADATILGSTIWRLWSTSSHYWLFNISLYGWMNLFSCCPLFEYLDYFKPKWCWQQHPYTETCACFYEKSVSLTLRSNKGKTLGRILTTMKWERKKD